MTSIARSSVRNGLLTLIPDGEYERVAPHLVTTDLVRGAKINTRGLPYTHVYFIESGIVSSIITDDTGRKIEVGVCGKEAFASKGAIFDSELSGWDELIQYHGKALTMPVEAFQTLLPHCPRLRELMLKYTYAFMVQTAFTSLATGYDTIPKRLARWLLMCQDRIGGDQIEMTHEFLSIMLGVRRPGVTDALHDLEGRGIVRAERGRITVLDREAMEQLAGASYGAPEAEYRRLLGSWD